MQELKMNEIELVSGGIDKEMLMAAASGAATGARVGGYLGPQGCAAGTLIGAAVAIGLYYWD